MTRSQLGRDFEEQVLGVRGSSRINMNDKLPFWQAIELVQFKQPDDWSPLHPPTQMGAEFLNAIRDEMRAEINGSCPPELKEKIIKNTGLYRALGTPADFFYHTDCFILCDMGERKEALVTVDLKMTDHGEELVRTNHFILPRDFFFKKDHRGRKRIQNLAGVISEHLVNQLKYVEVLPEDLDLAEIAQAS
jgi:hypothetical protein